VRREPLALGRGQLERLGAQPGAPGPAGREKSRAHTGVCSVPSGRLAAAGSRSGQGKCIIGLRDHAVKG
jgi:hypothetical protein